MIYFQFFTVTTTKNHSIYGILYYQKTYGFMKTTFLKLATPALSLSVIS